MCNGNRLEKHICISAISELRHTLNLRKRDSKIIKSLKSKTDKDSRHYSVLNTSPNHLRFWHDSSEDSRALIKMSLIHFGKSLDYIPITSTITAILLSKVNSIISGENRRIYNRVHLSSFLCCEEGTGACRVKTALLLKSFMHWENKQLEFKRRQHLVEKHQNLTAQFNFVWARLGNARGLQQLFKKGKLGQFWSTRSDIKGILCKKSIFSSLFRLGRQPIKSTLSVVLRK